MLILDGEDMNTTFRLLNEMKPENIIDLIVVPNPESSYAMRQLFCGNKLLAEKVKLYKSSVGEYIASLSPGQIEFTAIWLDYLGTYYTENKHNPRNDIINIFEKQLIADQGIFALTLFWGRGGERKWYESVEQLPKYARIHGYELESLCGLDYTYKCRDPKLSSSFDYDFISFMMFRVRKIAEQ